MSGPDPMAALGRIVDQVEQVGSEIAAARVEIAAERQARTDAVTTVDNARRRWALWLAVVLAVDLTLTVLLLVVAHDLSSSQNDQTALYHQQTIVACQSTNQVRATLRSVIATTEETLSVLATDPAAAAARPRLAAAYDQALAALVDADCPAPP